MKNLNARVLDKDIEVSTNDLIWAIQSSVDYSIYKVENNEFLIKISNETFEIKSINDLASNEVEVDDLIQAIDNCNNFAIWKSKDNENNFILEVF